MPTYLFGLVFRRPDLVCDDDGGRYHPRRRVGARSGPPGSLSVASPSGVGRPHEEPTVATAQRRQDGRKSPGLAGEHHQYVVVDPRVRAVPAVLLQHQPGLGNVSSLQVNALTACAPVLFHLHYVVGLILYIVPSGGLIGGGGFNSPSPHWP